MSVGSVWSSSLRARVVNPESGHGGASRVLLSVSTCQQSESSSCRFRPLQAVALSSGTAGELLFQYECRP